LRAIGSLLQSLHIEDFHLVTQTTLLMPRSTSGLGGFFIRSFTSCSVRNPTGKLCGTARADLYTVDRATVGFRQLAVSSHLDSVTRITTTCELKVLTGFTYLTVLLRSMLSNCLGFMSPNRHRDSFDVFIIHQFLLTVKKRFFLFF
jgi:hypothetical protein